MNYDEESQLVNRAMSSTHLHCGVAPEDILHLSVTPDGGLAVMVDSERVNACIVELWGAMAPYVAPVIVLSPEDRQQLMRFLEMAP